MNCNEVEGALNEPGKVLMIFSYGCLHLKNTRSDGNIFRNFRLVKVPFKNRPEGSKRFNSIKSSLKDESPTAAENL